MGTSPGRLEDPVEPSLPMSKRDGSDVAIG